MTSQRVIEDRGRRSADHSTHDRSGVKPVHGLRQTAMIGTGVAMTSGARARPGSEQAPVLAPLTVLVGSALLVLAQLYLAIPLAPVIGEVLGSGGSAAAAAVGTSYALAYGVGFLIFGPLSDRYGRKLILVAGVAVFAVVTAGLAAAASLSAVAVLRTLQGLVAASFGPVAWRTWPKRCRRVGGPPGSVQCRPPSYPPAFSVRSTPRRWRRPLAGAGCSAWPHRRA